MRRTLQRWSLGFFGTISSLIFVACVPELTISEPVDPSGVVVAQFDPTHPVPLLQIVPTPTGLAQNPDGSPGLNVATYACEGPNVKQCLQYVPGWPTTTPITLYFSGPIDLTTVKGNIKLIGEEPIDSKNISLIDFTITSSAPRALPSATCMAGSNGTVPDRAISADEIPPGIEVVLTPSRALMPSSSYIVLVESHVEGGLRAADGSRIEASSLFSLLNVTADHAPVDAEGNLLNALLRENVVSSVIASAFSGTPIRDLSTEQKAELDAAVAATGKDLFGLYGFFDQVITPLDPIFTSRSKLVLANAWQTGPEQVEIAFDPLRGVLPFPNTELLTVPQDPMGDPSGIHNVQVALPVDPTSTASATYAFLNSRTGFSNTAPLSIPTTGNIDQESLDENVMMYPLSEMGVIDSQNPVLIAARAVDSSPNTGPSIVIQPLVPLDQNATYVVGLKKGIKATDGSAVIANATFELLKTPAPIINDQNNVLADLVPVLQCSTVVDTGELATPNDVVGAAVAIEEFLKRPRWQHAFSAFEMLSPAVPRTELLMAYTIRTQDVTSEMDALLAPGAMGAAIDGWKQRRTLAGVPAVIPLPQMTVTGTAAIYRMLQLAAACEAVCVAGYTSIDASDPENCTPSPTSPLYDDPVCQSLMADSAGNLREIRTYLISGLGVTRGNPMNPGQGFFDITRLTAQADANFAPYPVLVAMGAGVSTAAPSAATIFQHGLGLSKGVGLFVANTLAGAGHVTVMMDLPFHGDRASDLIHNSTGIPCVDATLLPSIDPEQVTCQTSTITGVTTCDGCDGQRDPSSTGFMGPNLVSSRDNLRQATIDQLNLMSALQTDSAFDFVDTDDLNFFGTSLGSITGANLAAYTDDFQAMVLNAPGGGITNIIAGSPMHFEGLNLSLAAAGVCELVDPMDAKKGCKDTAAFRQFLYVAQWILDLGDPLATSVGIGETHSGVTAMSVDKILMQMPTPDLLIPSSTGDALGRSYGFDTSDNSEMSHFQTFRFSGEYATDMAHWARTSTTACHSALFRPNCGGKNLIKQFTDLGVEIPAGPLREAVDIVGNICGTAALQSQAVSFIVDPTATIETRTADLPPGVAAVAAAAVQALNLPIPVSLSCPTF